MSRVTANTITNITELLMRGHCFSSPESQKNLNNVTVSICRELAAGHHAGCCRHLTEKLSDSATPWTDSLLISVNTLTSIMSPTNCRTLQNIQKTVVENAELFKALVVLLGCSNQFISYSVCKALVYFLQSAGSIIEKLEYVIKSSIHFGEDFQDRTKAGTHYCQVLATFDLIRILCKQFHSRKSSQPSTLVCHCGLSKNRVVVPYEGKLFENLHPVSYLLQYSTVTFNKHFGREQMVAPSRQNSGAESDKAEAQERGMPYWFKMLDSSEKEVIFMSFLKMTKCLLKRYEITIADINKLMHLFREVLNAGKKLQRNSAKLIFDIMSDTLQKRRQDEFCMEAEQCQAETAKDVCCILGSREFLENVPYHVGQVGFGGTEFSENSDDQEGDVALLRKLTRVYFVALKNILESETAVRTANFELATTSLSTLSKYICCKLRLDLVPSSSKSESEWLCRLFADGDDDEMVFILFTVLQIYSHLKELLNQDPRHQELVNFSNFMKMLSPHLLFWSYMEMFDFDHSLLLDLLISSETDFLQYFISYLHCMKLDWEHCGVIFRKLEVEDRDEEEKYSESNSEGESLISKRMRVEDGLKEINSFSKKKQKTELTDPSFVQVENWENHEHMVLRAPKLETEQKSSPERTLFENNSNDGGINVGLDRVMSVMIRLRMSLERLQHGKMFPYTISPLIRLLVEIEQLYEK